MELLRVWKQGAEERARVRQGKPLKEIARDEYEPEHQKTVTALLLDNSLKTQAQLLKEKDIQVTVVGGEVHYIPGENIDFHFLGNLTALNQAVTQAMIEGEFDLNLEGSGLTFATVDPSLHKFFPVIKKGTFRIEPESQVMQFFLTTDAELEVLSGSVKTLFHPNRLRLEITNDVGSIKIIFKVPDGKKGNLNIKIKCNPEMGISEKDRAILRALWMITNHHGTITLSDPQTKSMIFKMQVRRDLEVGLQNMGKFAKLTDLYFEVLTYVKYCQAVMNQIDPAKVMTVSDSPDFLMIVDLFNGIKNGIKNSFFAKVHADDLKDSLKYLVLHPGAKYRVEVYRPVRILGTILTVARLRPKEPKLTLLNTETQQPITLTAEQLDAIKDQEVTVQVEGTAPFEFIQDSKIQGPMVRFIFEEPSVT
ncbi:hypothetical protein DC3_54010 [Deinococcus cellulosilyticus NBRC 106333 = KACC 11606]|uniref:Uncharacterized protein n=1 Tax=Deinococcus cellulosilyticus (strain DSM 18568 / NBRC 106333 / KACC 11606 / 5516J-15) TaxID=1223518 RepID=A0A511NB28_DEIC1|nr:hypothetical protein DC3_54010 [Deinococcus cellulosilyticus NBRC 106333 = KACC 11606]